MIIHYFFLNHSLDVERPPSGRGRSAMEMPLMVLHVVARLCLEGMDRRHVIPKTHIPHVKLVT